MMTDALVLANSRVMPMIRWLDQLVDPQERGQVSCAVMLLVIQKCVSEGRFKSAEDLGALARAIYESAVDDAYVVSD